MGRKLKKCVSIALTGIMLLGSIIPVFATVNETQTTNTSETLATDVYFNQDSTFTITVPKLVTLDNSKTSNYTVTVEGDIASDEEILVVPEDTFLMKDQATTGTKKDDVTATVMQNKESWIFNEFKTVGEGTITAADLTAGSWRGSFWFNIKLQSNYISVNAKNESGEDIHASATNITGDRKEQLLGSLEETGYIDSAEEVDALINVKSDDFEGMAETTFDVSNIAQEGDKVVILHYDETKQEWEYIGTETVNSNGTITGDFTSYSPVAFVKVKEDGTFEAIEEEILIYDYTNTKPENVTLSSNYTPATKPNPLEHWNASTYSGYLIYDFEKEVAISKITFQTAHANRTYTLSGSNDNSSWTKLGECISEGIYEELTTVNNNSNTKYRYYKVEIGTHSEWAGFTDLKFYVNNSIQNTTEQTVYDYTNTKPENVFYSSTYTPETTSNPLQTWCAPEYSGYIGYDFEKEIIISKVTFYTGCKREHILYGSNDNLNWINLGSCIATGDSTTPTIITNTSSLKYRYYKIELPHNGNYWAATNFISFYVQE